MPTRVENAALHMHKWLTSQGQLFILWAFWTRPLYGGIVMVEVSTEAILYEGINVYKVAAADRICEVLLSKNPDDLVGTIQRALSLAEESWERRRSQARSLLNSGSVRTPLKDPQDLLELKDFPRLFEAFFEDLFLDNGMSPNDQNELQQNVLHWAGDMAVARNRLANYGDSPYSWAEAGGLLTTANRILVAMGLEEAVAKVDGRVERLRANESKAL